MFISEKGGVLTRTLLFVRENYKSYNENNNLYGGIYYEERRYLY